MREPNQILTARELMATNLLVFRPEQPNLHVDVTDYFETRQNALHSHVSQVGERSDERDERSRKRLGDTGEKYGVELAEQAVEAGTSQIHQAVQSLSLS